MIGKSLKQIRNMSWEEKYRPQLVRQIILPTRIKNIIQHYVDTNTVGNMVFHSTSPGTGKTTTATCIANTLEAELLFLNTGEENKQSVSGVIANFSSTLSLDGKPKIVLLDEADTDGAVPMLNALRSAIERTASSTKYIFTCNNISRLPDAILSRCDVIDFTYHESDYDELYPQLKERLLIIANREVDVEMGKVVDESYIDEIIKSNYPDLRKMIKSLQFSYKANNGSIKPLPQTAQGERSYPLLLAELKKGNLHQARKILAENVVDMKAFHSRFAEYVLDNTDDKQSLAIGYAFATSARWDALSVPSDLNVGMGLFVDLIRAMGAGK